MRSRELNFLATVPDATEGDELCDSSVRHSNSDACSIDLSQEEGEGSPQQPYETRTRSNLRHQLRLTTLRGIKRLPLGAISPRPEEVGRTSPATCRSAITQDFGISLKPRNSTRRLPMQSERTTPRRLVIRFAGGRSDRLTHSMLGQVLDRCFDQRDRTNKSVRYVVSLKKFGQISSSENGSSVEQSSGNKSTSVSKEEHVAIPSLGTVLSLQDAATARELGVDQSVIKESAEETMIHDYWTKKDEVEDKYRKMGRQVDVEELAEISLKLSKGQGDPELMKSIYAIKEYYANVKTLLAQQKLMEQEDLLKEYQRRISVAD